MRLRNGNFKIFPNGEVFIDGGILELSTDPFSHDLKVW